MKDFLLSNKDIEYTSKLLQDQFPYEGILSVHEGILFSPRFIMLNALPEADVPVNLADPKFRINTVHVVSAMRILGISKFGFLFFPLLKQWNINNWDAVNVIISALQFVYKDSEYSPGLWISTIVDLKESHDSIFDNSPILSSTISEEENLCEEIVDKSLSVFSIEEESEDKLMNFFDNIRKFLEEGEE